MDRERVLLVEDNIEYASDLRMLLQHRFEVRCVQDAVAAEEALAEQPFDQPFDAVLVDLDLPAGLAGGGPEEGRELALRTRARHGAGVRIVVLSQEVPEHLRAELEAVADAVLTKSCSIEEVEAALSRGGGKGAARRWQEHQRTPPTHCQPPVDRES